MEKRDRFILLGAIAAALLLALTQFAYSAVTAGAWMISKDRKAYDYLPDSIVEFPAREEFISLMQQVGFEGCYRRSQTLGIAQIYVGRKP